MTGRVTNMGSKKKEPPTWEAADDLFDELGRRDAKQRAEALARATVEAQRRGKEPFDLEKLETMCYTGTSDGIRAPLEQRRAELEYSYYVHHPSITTLAAFADYIERANKG